MQLSRDLFREKEKIIGQKMNKKGKVLAVFLNASSCIVWSGARVASLSASSARFRLDNWGESSLTGLALVLEFPGVGERSVGQGFFTGLSEVLMADRAADGQA